MFAVDNVQYDAIAIMFQPRCFVIDATKLVEGREGYIMGAAYVDPSVSSPSLLALELADPVFYLCQHLIPMDEEA